jgi:hypothetical protein
MCECRCKCWYKSPWRELGRSTNMAVNFGRLFLPDMKRKPSVFCSFKVPNLASQLSLLIRAMGDEKKNAVVGVVAEEGKRAAQNEREEKKNWKWVHCGIPFRASRGTYAVSDYKHLPPLPPSALEKFKSIKAPSDVFAHADWLQEQLNSPTSCYIDQEDGVGCLDGAQSGAEGKGKEAQEAVTVAAGKAVIIYRDQQGCVLWHHDPKTHAVYFEHSGEKWWVAHSLQEFFSRTWFEGTIWHKAASCAHPDTFASHSALFGTDLEDPEGLMEALSLELEVEQAAYIRCYYALNHVGTLAAERET